MYDFPIALQLYSVRTDMEADFKGTLKKVKSLGYNGVEFVGLFGHSAEEVKNMCIEIGITPISAHVPYAELLKGDETFKTYSDIGCKYIVIPWINEEYLAGGEKNAEFYENVKKFGELANKYGMKLCYHNHDFEFEKVDGEYKIDLLYKAISPDLLSTQLDTCWVKGGNMYALIGNDDSKKEAAAGSFEFRPLGSGLQDFPSILEASKEVGAHWVVVEQDEPSMGKSRMECAEMSINYLKSIF